jgi:hypothetical protein
MIRYIEMQPNMRLEGPLPSYYGAFSQTFAAMFQAHSTRGPQSFFPAILA